MELTCKTTREHFEKYCAMRSQMGVSFLNTTIFGTKEELTKLFLKDRHLNQIPIGRFDAYWPAYRKLRPGISLAETSCVIKHSLIYQVIGAIPDFID